MNLDSGLKPHIIESMKLTRPLSSIVIIGLLLSTLAGTSLASANSTSKSTKGKAASFWTAKRINEAIAFEMVFEKGSKIAKRVPAVKETRRPGGGGGSGSVIGSSWTQGGLPLTAGGKVFFTFDGLSFYQCSGALVEDNDPGYSIVLTAGHCLFEHANSNGEGIGDGVYAEHWIFVPSYDLEQVRISGCVESNKCWEAHSLRAHENYRNQTGFNSTATKFDWGFAKITETKAEKHPDELGEGSNYFPIEFASTLSSSTVASSFGYPAAGKYKGNDLVYSRGPISFDANNSNATYALASDMTGGCSGGPWLSDMGTSLPFSGTLRSVNSYKYGTTKFIYGPIFDSSTFNTFSESKAS